MVPRHYLTQCWIIVHQTLRTIFSEILVKIQTFSFKKMHLKVSSAKCRPFCLGLNVLIKELLNNSLAQGIVIHFKKDNFQIHSFMINVMNILVKDTCRHQAISWTSVDLFIITVCRFFLGSFGFSDQIHGAWIRLISTWLMWAHEKFVQGCKLTMQDPWQLSMTKNFIGPSSQWVG